MLRVCAVLFLDGKGVQDPPTHDLGGLNDFTAHRQLNEGTPCLSDHPLLLSLPPRTVSAGHTADSWEQEALHVLICADTPKPWDIRSRASFSSRGKVDSGQLRASLIMIPMQADRSRFCTLTPTQTCQGPSRCIQGSSNLA